MCNYEVLKEHCVIMRFSIVITLWCSINTQLRKRNYVMIHRNYKVQNGNYKIQNCNYKVQNGNYRLLLLQLCIGVYGGVWQVMSQ